MKPQQFRKQIGEQLRTHRLKKGLSVKAFAEKISISASTVTKIEKGYWNFSIEKLFIFAKALDLEIEINENRN